MARRVVRALDAVWVAEDVVASAGDVPAEQVA